MPIPNSRLPTPAGLARVLRLAEESPPPTLVAVERGRWRIAVPVARPLERLRP